MNELLNKLLGSHQGHWADLLKNKAGFSLDEAKKFLPGVLQQVQKLLGGGDLSKLLDVKSLMSKFDVAGLAKSAGIDAGKATKGLDALGPDLVEKLKGQAGGLEGMLGKIGGLGGSVGKLFGK